MRKINSWRLSRLLEPSAWKRLFYYRWWFFLVVVFVFIGLLIYTTSSEPSERYYVVLWMAGIGCVLSFLDTVLGADRYYYIQLKSTHCHVYVYNQKGYFSNEQEIVFLQDDTEAHISTQSTVLREKGYQYKNLNDSMAFLYCLNGDNNKWYYLNSDSDEHQFLGKKISAGEANVFLTGISDTAELLELQILHGKTVKHLWVDSFVFGNAYVPPIAKKNIRSKIISKLPIEEPDEYLIVENKKEYKVYGLYFNYNKIPRCYELYVPVIIFQEAEERVGIRCCHNGEYDEIFRKLPATRWINDVIPERSKDYAQKGYIGGTVWKLDEQTNTLQKLYEGRYRALGFADGSIVGDGWEYTPTSKDGKEYDTKS